MFRKRRLNARSFCHLPQSPSHDMSLIINLSIRSSPLAHERLEYHVCSLQFICHLMLRLARSSLISNQVSCSPCYLKLIETSSYGIPEATKYKSDCLISKLNPPYQTTGSAPCAFPDWIGGPWGYTNLTPPTLLVLRSV
jgi:hypothetical protein